MLQLRQLLLPSYILGQLPEMQLQFTLSHVCPPQSFLQVLHLLLEFYYLVFFFVQQEGIIQHPLAILFLHRKVQPSLEQPI